MYIILILRVFVLYYVKDRMITKHPLRYHENKL